MTNDFYAHTLLGKPESEWDFLFPPFGDCQFAERIPFLASREKGDVSPAREPPFSCFNPRHRFDERQRKKIAAPNETRTTSEPSQTKLAVFESPPTTAIETPAPNVGRKNRTLGGRSSNMLEKFLALDRHACQLVFPYR